MNRLQNILNALFNGLRPEVTGLGQLVFLFVCLLSVPPIQADVVKLRNGGLIRGEVTSKPTGKQKSKECSTVTVKTILGGVVEVPNSTVVEIVQRAKVLERYELLKRLTPDTVEGHRELAIWCKNQKLEEQRREQLQQILRLKPDDTPAHLALGHIKVGHQWFSREEYDRFMQAQGYVYYQGRYVTVQERELLEEKTSFTQKERDWFSKIRIWYRWLKGTKPKQRRLAWNKLRSVQDPAAVRALCHFLGKDADVAVRRLLATLLGRIHSEQAFQKLVQLTLQDHAPSVRLAAVKELSKRQWCEQARAVFRGALKSKSNLVVRHAAEALGEIGTSADVPSLIEAIVTVHSYRVPVTTYAPTYCFSTDGSFQIGGVPTVPLPPEVEIALRTGQLPYGVVVTPDPRALAARQTRLVRVQVRQENPEVVGALQKLTGQNFGFDRQAWWQWLESQQAGQQAH